jgi:hypothetical protein
MKIINREKYGWGDKDVTIQRKGSKTPSTKPANKPSKGK